MDVTERIRKNDISIDSIQIKRKRETKPSSTVKHIPVTRSRMKGTSTDLWNNENSENDNTHKLAHKRQKVYNLNDEIENIPTPYKQNDHCENK